jgi:hypothetical protein
MLACAFYAPRLLQGRITTTEAVAAQPAAAPLEIRLSARGLPECKNGIGCDLQALLMVWTADGMVNKCHVPQRPFEGRELMDVARLTVDVPVTQVGVLFERGDFAEACSTSLGRREEKLVEWNLPLPVRPQQLAITCDLAEKRCWRHADVPDATLARVED